MLRAIAQKQASYCAPKNMHNLIKGESKISFFRKLPAPPLQKEMTRPLHGRPKRIYTHLQPRNANSMVTLSARQLDTISMKFLDVQFNFLFNSLEIKKAMIRECFLFSQYFVEQLFCFPYWIKILVHLLSYIHTAIL